MSFKISASLVGLEEFNKALDEVKQKAEELEQAIQRLNDIELKIEVTRWPYLTLLYQIGAPSPIA